MRAKFIAGRLYSNCRWARTSLQRDWRVSRKQKSWFSNIAEKAAAAAVTQVKYADTDDKKEDLVCPVKYFKEVDFLRSLKSNELLKAVGKEDKTEVSLKVGKAVRSMAVLILKSHAKGIPLGECLKLSNIMISRSAGEFVMVKPPRLKASWGNLLGDYRRGADLLEELAKEVLGPNVLMPSLWLDYIAKMREEFPKVELLVYHTIFLPMNMRYILRVLIDQRFRKDFDSLEAKQKKAIRKFLQQLGEKREDDLASIRNRDEFIRFICLKSRRGAQGRRGKPNAVLSSEEAVWSEKARDLISINRDGVVHGCKQDVSDLEKAAMPNLKRHWRTQEKVIELLDVEYDLLLQTFVDLCYDDEKVLWKIIGVPELFGETDDTWKSATQAVNKEMEAILAGKIKESF